VLPVPSGLFPVGCSSCSAVGPFGGLAIALGLLGELATHHGVGVLANQALNYLASGKVPKRIGNAHPNIVPYQVFPAADGR
jgi:crotonobetainyl-CoA:carnitine CoA-transferase CaiB-like acyl-CoA transferase